jgi:hypothetical protein
MKTLASILSFAHAEMREWTDAGTSRTLTAKLIEKKKDMKSVHGIDLIKEVSQQ